MREKSNELCVFVASEPGSLLAFKTAYSQNSQSGQVWLLDVSLIDSIDIVLDMLSDAKVGFSDDLYVYRMTYTNPNQAISIWEVYRLPYRKQLTMLKYGTWTAIDSLSAVQTKWVRRRNMMVR